MTICAIITLGTAAKLENCNMFRFFSLTLRHHFNVALLIYVHRGIWAEIGIMNADLECRRTKGRTGQAASSHFGDFQAAYLYRLLSGFGSRALLRVDYNYCTKLK